MTDLHEESRRSWEVAQEQAGPDRQVCGFYKDSPDGKQPLYFTMPRTATDDQIEEQAFLLTHGRPMSDLDKTVRRMAREHAGRLERYR